MSSHTLGTPEGRARAQALRNSVTQYQQALQKFTQAVGNYNLAHEKLLQAAQVRAQGYFGGFFTEAGKLEAEANDLNALAAQLDSEGCALRDAADAMVGE
ncbi:MAG: hypothetical protein K2W97_03600 [Chthoniobacterales bacterium]|nr:hypothetical protein [Chthoniobacterales bacterium]